jgi:hypothetical protein
MLQQQRDSIDSKFNEMGGGVLAAGTFVKYMDRGRISLQDLQINPLI